MPDHVYNFEWQRHFVEQHEHMLPRVEALYKAVWKRYINSPELQCPIVGLTLPIVHRCVVGSTLLCSICTATHSRICRMGR